MLMASNQENGCQQARFALFPFMAQGHMIPMFDIARLLAARGVAITILLTPHNAARLSQSLDLALTSGLSISVAYLSFPCAEAGLPEGCENYDMLRADNEKQKFFNAAMMLRDQVEALLKKLNPCCLISDACFPWAMDVARNLCLPRIVFHGMSCFSLSVWLMLYGSEVVKAVASDTEYFVVPNLPHKIEFTMAQLRGTPQPIPQALAKIRDGMKEGSVKAIGTVVNTFEELEPEYVKEYGNATGNRVWCIGPVSLCNKNELDKAARGNKASIDQHQWLKWLDSQKPGSVVYACLGSISRISSSHQIELGLALEALNHPFVWVVRTEKDELRTWLDNENFEERVSNRGLLIHGWAPQVLILSHPSVGGFLTHCGWNSTLEGITAGLPLITWPLCAEQFSNEKLVVNVIKTGVRVGVEMPVTVGDESREVQVTRKEIKLAIDEVMDGGDEGRARRERARKLGETAKRAAADRGGSSYENITRLIEDVQQAKYAFESGKDAKFSH